MSWASISWAWEWVPKLFGWGRTGIKKMKVGREKRARLLDLPERIDAIELRLTALEAVATANSPRLVKEALGLYWRKADWQGGGEKNTPLCPYCYQNDGKESPVRLEETGGVYVILNNQLHLTCRSPFHPKVEGSDAERQFTVHNVKYEQIRGDKDFFSGVDSSDA